MADAATTEADGYYDEDMGSEKIDVNFLDEKDKDE